MRVMFLLAVLLAVARGLAAAQATNPQYVRYREAVVTYKAGNFEKAATTISGWSESDLRQMVSLILDQQSQADTNPMSRRDPYQGRLGEPAAMLHTEMVLRSRVSAPRAIGVHLDLAEALGKGIRFTAKSPADREALLGFRQRWYALVASFFVSNLDPKAAMAWVDRGLDLQEPGIAGEPQFLYLMRGIVHEMIAHVADPDCQRPGCGSPKSSRPSQLLFAREAYQKALEIDPALVDARLRRGRVLFLTNERREARVEVEEAIKQTIDKRLQYLGHLFLGDICRMDNDTACAMRHYEAARAAGPQYQTPYVAIGFVEQMTGRGQRLRSLATSAASVDVESDRDPWWGYNNGAVDRENYLWLRTYVERRP